MARDLDYLAMQIRVAIQDSLPIAEDQFLTMCMPGRVINTRNQDDGGEFVPPKVDTDSGNDKVSANEARLVDSMIPLSAVMLGATGKSVSRSYLAALDHLVPRNTDLDRRYSEHHESKGSRGTSVDSEYTAAMNRLRTTAPVSEGKENTAIDIYLEKQHAYSVAVAHLEWVSATNAEAQRRNAGMNAEDFARVMKAATDNVERASMDWVANGNKVVIDHQFGLLDPATAVMSRIEMAKDALRSAIVSDGEDNTEWARVTLAPSNWATLCQSKAEAWLRDVPPMKEMMHGSEPMTGDTGVDNPHRAPPVAPAGPSGDADPWTTIQFTSTSMSSNEFTTSPTMEADIEASAGWGLFSGNLETNVNAASEDMWKATRDCSISGSFSALVVEVNRPWLDGELFEEHDVDTAPRFKLSPGPKNMKAWLNGGLREKLDAYGAFPWYPTAFVVAADIVIEIACSESVAEIHASSFAASASANYACFASGNASGKGSLKSRSHRAEVTENGMRLSFGAPQIIGWVSTVLPELPRGKRVG